MYSHTHNIRMYVCTDSIILCASPCAHIRKYSRAFCAHRICDNVSLIGFYRGCFFHLFAFYACFHNDTFMKVPLTKRDLSSAQSSAHTQLAQFYDAIPFGELESKSFLFLPFSFSRWRSKKESPNKMEQMPRIYLSMFLHLFPFFAWISWRNLLEILIKRSGRFD